MLAFAMLAAGAVGVTFLVVRAVRFSMGLIRRPIDNVTAKLASEQFVITHGMLSIDRDVMIALAEDGRLALCELGRRGVVLTTRIVERGELSAEALEDGGELDEHIGAIPRHGKLLLRVTYKRRPYHIVFAHAVPQSSDSPPDYEEYEEMRGMVRWWRETIAGRTPGEPYPLASHIAVYSSGSVVEQLTTELVNRLLGPKLPKATAIEKPASD